MMRLEVRLYAGLRRYRPASAFGAPHHAFPILLPAGSDVAALAAALGIPDGLVQAAAVNDEAVEPTAVLHDGDRVGLFPVAAGG